MSNCFDDSDYFIKLFPCEVFKSNTDKHEKCNVISGVRLENAYKQAADIRKFEIELFWKRGTYYWAFILAAFTAHFALLGMIFSTFNKDENKELSLKNICELPGFSLFALAVTAFFCFFFSLAWTLVNKGSKFWQKNWEAHIDMLEENITGNLYETFLNTNFKGDEKEFSKNPLCYKSYDYSVTKITTLTSMLLTVASGVLFLFYIILHFFKWRKGYVPFCELFTYIIFPIIFLFIACAIVYYLLKHGSGNGFDKKNTRDTSNRWYQRSKTYADDGKI